MDDSEQTMNILKFLISFLVGVVPVVYCIKNLGMKIKSLMLGYIISVILLFILVKLGILG
jgi:hypothetical protein